MNSQCKILYQDKTKFVALSKGLNRAMLLKAGLIELLRDEH